MQKCGNACTFRSRNKNYAPRWISARSLARVLGLGGKFPIGHERDFRASPTKVARSYRARERRIYLRFPARETDGKLFALTGYARPPIRPASWRDREGNARIESFEVYCISRGTRRVESLRLSRVLVTEDDRRIFYKTLPLHFCAESSAVLPSASSDLEKIQQPVKVVLSSTCHHAYTACK